MPRLRKHERIQVIGSRPHTLLLDVLIYTETPLGDVFNSLITLVNRSGRPRVTFVGGCVEMELLLRLTSLSSSIKMWMASKTWIRNCNFFQLNVETFHHIPAGQRPTIWCCFTRSLTSSARLVWYETTLLEIGSGFGITFHKHTSTLMGSMRLRCQACINANDEYTEY